MNILETSVTEFETVFYVGIYAGIYEDILILANQYVEEGVAYLVDLSKVVVDGEKVKIGSKESNIVAIRGVT